MNFQYGFFVDHTNSGFSWLSLIGPALQVVLGGIAAIWLASYKAQLDAQADARKLEQDSSVADHKGDIERMLQTHESEMKKQQARYSWELAQQAKDYESRLQQIAFRNQTKFVQIHLTRIKIIADLYTHIHETKRKLQDLSLGENADDANTMYHAYKEAYLPMVQYFDANRLYFPKSLEEMLNGTFTKFSLTATGYKFAGTFYDNEVKSGKWHDKAEALAGELQAAPYARPIKRSWHVRAAYGIPVPLHGPWVPPHVSVQRRAAAWMAWHRLQSGYARRDGAESNLEGVFPHGREIHRLRGCEVVSGLQCAEMGIVESARARMM